jgi:hypothetical protein
VERTTIAGETEVLGENLPQRHFVPPDIPHDQVRFRTPDSKEVGLKVNAEPVKYMLLSRYQNTGQIMT